MSIVSSVCASTPWPGKVPGKISLNNPRAAQKTAAVEDRTQTFRERQERRVRSPFLRMPVLRLRLAGDLSFKVRVREIIERDDRLQVEQGLDGPEHMVLKRGLVLEEMIRRAVQGPITQGAKVDAEQFSGSAARTEPGVGRPFRSRLRHPADDIGQRTALLPFVETECTQLIGKIQQLERQVRASRSPHARCQSIMTGRASLFWRDWTSTLSQSGASDRCSWRSSRRLAIRRATGPWTSQSRREAS